MEAPQARLTDYVLPVDHNVDADYSAYRMSDRKNEDITTTVPFTKGGKLGLLKALRSYDDIFEQRLPRRSVWLKYRQHSTHDSMSAIVSPVCCKLTGDDVVSCYHQRAEQVIHRIVAQLGHRDLRSRNDLTYVNQQGIYYSAKKERLPPSCRDPQA